MNQLEELISNLCPNGVPMFKLGELEDNKVLKLGRGDVISKNDLNDTPGTFPVYSSSAASNGTFGRYGKFMFDDERITWSIDGGGKFFYRPMHRYSVTNVCGWLKVVQPDKLITKYIYYVLISAWGGRTYNYSVKAHPSVIREDYLIPLPPMEVQREIVRILDIFTELEAELEAELDLRKTQQIHYRNHFFSKAMLSKYCPNGVPEHSLGSLLIANRGGGTPSTTKPDYWDGEIPWASIGDLNASRMYITETRRTITDAGLKSGATSLVKAGDVLAAVKISPGLMKIASRDVAINQDIRGLTLDPRLDAAFLVYFFRTFSIIANGTIVKGITNATLEKVKVPVPPLEVQHEIVTALNAMNELELSLETELLGRRSQYESYRNKLLTFKELEVA